MRNVLDKSCRENQNTHFTFSNVFRKLCRLWVNVEKFGGARDATNDVTIWRTRLSKWISKATCTHVHAHAHALGHKHARTRACVHSYVIFIAFPRQRWYANACQCYVTRTLSVFLYFCSVFFRNLNMSVLDRLLINSCNSVLYMLLFLCCYLIIFFMFL
jgi:hypothetical protein